MGKKRVWYIPIIVILIVFILLTLALLGRDIFLSGSLSNQELKILDDEVFQTTERMEGTEGKECLYIWDSRDENSKLFHEQMPRILYDMQVEYTELDVAYEKDMNLEQFDKVILGFTDYRENSELLLEVVDWTEAGGALLIAQVPTAGTMYSWMSSKMGVTSTGVTYYEVSGLRLFDGFMAMGDEDTYEIADAFESAIAVTVSDECEVYMVTDDDREIPLLWEKEAGEGQMVVVNLGRYDKSYRGIYAAAYSLLGEYCAWPVINSSAFYLDGVPFPIPSGDNQYIIDEYGDNMDLYTFYVREWTNDLMELSRKYGIAFTGTLQENNDGDIDPPYESTASTHRYEYFISLLQESGGEVGLYGYNQQPLCIEADNLQPSDPELYQYGYEEDMELEYWASKHNMEAALQEVKRFQQNIDKSVMTVYTPPYGILSESGLSALKNSLPEIRAVAGLYQGYGYASSQEFEVGEDGMIMTPRITSGSYVGAEQKMIALSELNMHYVNTHSISPNDVLNPDAGAADGWGAMLDSLDSYEEWLESAAPQLRRHSGSELAAVVQRYHYLDVDETITENGIEMKLDNFQEDAWFLMRFNEWEPDVEEGVEGGKLEKLTGNLYLLEAERDHVTIRKKVDS